MPLVRTSYEKKFSQAEGQTLLVAAEEAGLCLPYSCKTGRCGTCKCRVLRGKSVAITDELGLTCEEKAEGFVLSCVRIALTDVLIEVDDLGDQVLPEVKTLPVRIGGLEKPTPDVLCVRLRLPPNTSFRYLAGQYVDVIGPGGIRRSYSIANAPATDNQLQLHIRAVQGGAMSHYWFEQAKVNDLLRINGPLGSFFTRSLNGLQLVFMATGTGIAPIKAMLEELENSPLDDQPLSVTVYWGGRELRDLYVDPFQWHRSLRFVPVLSRAAKGWTGARGYVQQSLLADKLDFSNTVVYACGSYAMIQSAKAVLTEAGLSTKRFFSDAFVSSGM
jgi:CDP-4-dehydro-6-deoxyglucose reductase, E3